VIIDEVVVISLYAAVFFDGEVGGLVGKYIPFGAGATF
jgi:hypothetical protein